MTQLLISVTSPDEAMIALENGADFIDLKNPEEGALGALPLQTVAEIVGFVKSQGNGRGKHTSATIGDLPMNPELIANKVEQLASTGVDIIKIGFFPDSGKEIADYGNCLSRLRLLIKGGMKLVAVLFAEYEYPDCLVGWLKEAGFYGVMVDTANKDGSTFLDYCPDEKVAALQGAICKYGMLFGLAGSLSIKNIEKVMDFKPDYVGFRGGVCRGNQRSLDLDPDKIFALRKVMSSFLL